MAKSRKWVTVTGSNFTGVSVVTIGTTNVTFDFVNDNTILAYVPHDLTGTLHTTVTTAPSITSTPSSADQVAIVSGSSPTITGLSIGYGPSAGGTQLTLTGTGFHDVTDVYFGQVDVTQGNFTINSDSQITILTPSNSVGTFDITVVSPEGASADSAATPFQFTATTTPAITGLSSSSGLTGGNYSITISGPATSRV